MGTRSAFVTLIGGLGVFSAACGSGSPPLSPTATPTTTLAQLSMSPDNNASLPQNNPATGCSLLDGAGATRGRGFAIQFHWTTPSSPSPLYEIYVTRVGAPTPFLDVVVATTDFTWSQCHSFVADENLQNWQWRTRENDLQGGLGAWTRWASFEFSPCRLNDGTLCRATE